MLPFQPLWRLYPLTSFLRKTQFIDFLNITWSSLSQWRPFRNHWFLIAGISPSNLATSESLSDRGMVHKMLSSKIIPSMSYFLLYCDCGTVLYVGKVVRNRRGILYFSFSAHQYRISWCKRFRLIGLSYCCVFGLIRSSKWLRIRTVTTSTNCQKYLPIRKTKQPHTRISF